MGVTLREIVTKFRGIALNSATKTGAAKDALADTAGSNALGLADADGSPLLGATSNGGSTATTSDSALFHVPVPSDWQPGCKIGIVARAKVSAARQVSATIDFTAKLIGDTLGSDLVATAAQSINSTTAGWKYFSITPTGLIPGRSVLAIVVILATDDTGAAANGAASCSEIALEYEGRY